MVRKVRNPPFLMRSCPYRRQCKNLKRTPKLSLHLTTHAILVVSELGSLPRATQEKSGGTSRQHRCKRRTAGSTYPSPIFCLRAAPLAPLA